MDLSRSTCFSNSLILDFDCPKFRISEAKLPIGENSLEKRFSTGETTVDTPDRIEPARFTPRRSRVIKNNEIPVFWACGVTPQSVVENCKPEFCITHKPGAMLITDKLNSSLAAIN